MLPCLTPHLTIPFSRIHPHPRSKPQRFERLLTLAESFPPHDKIVKSLKKPLDRSKREKRRANKELDGRGVKWRLFHPIVRLIYLPYSINDELFHEFSTYRPFEKKNQSILMNSWGKKGNREEKEEDKSDWVNYNWKFYYSFYYSYSWIDNC